MWFIILLFPIIQFHRNGIGKFKDLSFIVSVWLNLDVTFSWGFKICFLSLEEGEILILRDCHFEGFIFYW